MHIAYTPAQEHLRAELRRYFAELMTREIREALDNGPDYGDGEAYKQVVRQLGKDGWLALSWPEEYGGRGGDMMDQLIFTDEASIAHVPVPFLTINTVGPTIMRYGTAEQKATYLPRIANGEIHFSIGYSEPDAGTDLASLKTTAIRGADGYLINGQKMWTSLIQYADYVWLACRTSTSPEASAALPRHKGLSILIVPTDAPGFSWTPVPTLAGPVTSATYYQDIRVPLTALVGEENKGWPLITNQLNHERVALTSSAPVRTALDDVTAWAQETGAIQHEWVRLNLARVHAKVDYLKLLNWRIASSSEPLGPAAASATKVFGTEFATEAYRLLMEVLGASATIRAGSPGAVLAGRIERLHRSALILTFGGGTNEVQRDIIAGTALRLPPAPRHAVATPDRSKPRPL